MRARHARPRGARQDGASPKPSPSLNPIPNPNPNPDPNPNPNPNPHGLEARGKTVLPAYKNLRAKHAQLHTRRQQMSAFAR